MDIPQTARRLCSQYGTTDPQAILGMMGVSIVTCPLSGLRGFYKKIERNVLVFVDSGLDPHTRRFVLGHELGHHILHRGVNRIFLERCTYLKTSRYEREADLFSACLLAPDPQEILTEDCTVEGVAARLGVSQRVAELYITEACRPPQ